MEIQYRHDIELFPAGYRFSPTDEELIVYYLSKKVRNENLPPNRIHEVQLYDCHPQRLAEDFRPTEGDVWFFFTSRTRKYKNGKRPKRDAGDGYWKATGNDKPIGNWEGVKLGSKRALVYYEGKSPHGTKTNWIMHEYTVKDPPLVERYPNDDTLDRWVLCRIYHKGDRAANDVDVDDQNPTESPLSVDDGVSSEEILMNAQNNMQIVPSDATPIQSPTQVEHGTPLMNMPHAHTDMQIVCVKEEDGVRLNDVHGTSRAYQSTTGNGFVPSIDIQSTSHNINSWQYRAMFKIDEVDSLTKNGHDQQIYSSFDHDDQNFREWHPNEVVAQQLAPAEVVAQQLAPAEVVVQQSVPQSAPAEVVSQQSAPQAAPAEVVVQQSAPSTGFAPGPSGPAPGGGVVGGPFCRPG